MKKRVRISNEVIRLMCDICYVEGYVEDNVLDVTARTGRWKLIFDGDEVRELYRLDGQNKLNEIELETTNFYEVMRNVSGVKEFW